MAEPAKEECKLRFWSEQRTDSSRTADELRDLATVASSLEKNLWWQGATDASFFITSAARVYTLSGSLGVKTKVYLYFYTLGCIRKCKV